MPRVQPQQPLVLPGPTVGPLGVVALLALISPTAELGQVGWATGLAAGVAGCLLLTRSLAHHGRARLSPADRVTLTRLVLSCGVAALTAAALTYESRVGPTLVVLAAVALTLDCVDGLVARLTGSVSTLGARFDLETDALLILVLSLYVGRELGWWVVVIGAARYAFVAAGWVWPWLRGTVPPRDWCKVVAAAQGVVLTVVAADLLPGAWETTLVGAALVLLAESFGREAWQLWRLERLAPLAPLAPGSDRIGVLAPAWSDLSAAGGGADVPSGLSDA